MNLCGHSLWLLEAVGEESDSPYLLPEFVGCVSPLYRLYAEVQSAVVLLDGRVSAVCKRTGAPVAEPSDVILVSTEGLRLGLDFVRAVPVIDDLHVKSAQHRDSRLTPLGHAASLRQATFEAPLRAVSVAAHKNSRKQPPLACQITSSCCMLHCGCYGALRVRCTSQGEAAVFHFASPC